MLREAVERLSRRENLELDVCRRATAEIMTGQAPASLVAAFLMGLRVKGETVDELQGCALALRSAGLRIAPRRDPLVDTCGTGGDGASTFNISTVAALVVAGAGAVVAKHGNRSVSSSCGSADVLEALGVPLMSDPALVERCVEEVGFGFLFAPHFHPAMRHVAGVRRELGVRTIFNLMGPISNPAGARAQVIGVFSRDWVRPMAELALRLGVESCLVVHGHGGLDELTLSGPAQVARLEEGDISEYQVDPLELGLPRASLAELAGGGPEANAAIAREILEGRDQGPRALTVALNAGAALMVAGLVPNLREGVALARATLASGAALGVLERVSSWTGS